MLNYAYRGIGGEFPGASRNPLKFLDTILKPET